MLTQTEIACSHCTLPVPAGLVRDGDAAQFCCPGCRAVYEQIHACGLEDYYRLRDAGDLLPQAAALPSDAAAFDSPAYADLYVETAGHEARTEFVLEGVTCAACVWLVERLPKRVPGVIDAQLSLADNTLRVRWDSAETALSQIAAELMRFGYRPHPARGVKQADLDRRELRGRLVDLGVAGALTGNLMLLATALYAGWMQGMDRPYEQMMRWASLLLGVMSLAWPGRTFFRGAMSAIRLRSVNFDLPIAMALAVGGVASSINVLRGSGEIYFDSLAALIFLLLIGRLVQFSQQRRARTAVELLFSLTPSTCRIVDGDATRSIPIQSLQAEDTVEVHAEELFPADGVVMAGQSSADTSLLTGESKPVDIAPGDLVYGGARNVGSTVRVHITAAGGQTRVGKLMKLIEQGLADKPPIVRLTDRVASRFTWVVLTAAVLAFAYWARFGVATATDIAVALLIVTCPCVLGLAVPMTFALSIGRLARRGILVKSASALERLAHGGRLVLDKTGTLTAGRMSVVAWEGDPQWQGVVREIERHAVHPVGRALFQAYENREAPAEWRGADVSIRTQTGGIFATAGVRSIAVGSLRFIRTLNATLPPSFARQATSYEANGHTVVMIAVDGKVSAIAALADPLRHDAAATIGRLRRAKFTPQICSGDGQGAVARVARELDFEQGSALGGMLPEEKLNHVRAHGGTVMIGDGVNDAAALAAADVGIAVAGGAEAALAAADVYIARPGLAGVAELVDVARHTLAIVHRNVLIATSYNVLAGVLAVCGLMHPLNAAVLMPMSSVTVMTLTVLAARRGPKGSAR
ncbi:MAG: heavy metal translocating P-type ATPase [Tepidisphaeraceae bacterium]